MSWTKRQLVMQALSELGLSGYAFNMQPQQLEDAMIKMDGMLAGWETSGIYLGYPIPANPKAGDLDQDTTMELQANEAVYLNLALAIAPSFGKQVQNETRRQAAQAYNRLLNRATLSPEKKYAKDSLAGAGNKCRVFLPDEEVEAHSKEGLDLS